MVVKMGSVNWESNAFENRPFLHTFFLDHSVRWGINSYLKNIPPPLSCQAPINLQTFQPPSFFLIWIHSMQG